MECEYKQRDVSPDVRGLRNDPHVLQCTGLCSLNLQVHLHLGRVFIFSCPYMYLLVILYLVLETQILKFYLKKFKIRQTHSTEALS